MLSDNKHNIKAALSQFRFPSDLTRVRQVSHEVLDRLKDLHLNSSVLFDIRLCFEEAFINAVKYGNKKNPNLTVDVDIKTDKDVVEIIVRDYGEGFDSSRYADPSKDKNLAKPGGKGVYLIKKLMDEAVYKDGGRCLHMKKFIKRLEGQDNS